MLLNAVVLPSASRYNAQGWKTARRVIVLSMAFMLDCSKDLWEKTCCLNLTQQAKAEAFACESRLRPFAALESYVPAPASTLVPVATSPW